MVRVISSVGLKGMESYRVQEEVQLLPDVSVKESKDRVMAVLYANDCEISKSSY